MIVAIMQPYFFPYIGYFQLMRAVDQFVFYDDAQYMKNGWINRNRIAIGEEEKWITLPVKHTGLHTKINERQYILEENIETIKRKLLAAYSRASNFRKGYAFVCDLLDFDDSNVAVFNANLLRESAQQLGIDCRFTVSSRIAQSGGLRGEAKVIDMCKVLGADHYINPIGGLELYDPEHFSEAGLRLSFLRTTLPPTHFRNGEAHLSIVDTVMHNEWEGAQSQLERCEILSKEQLVIPSSSNLKLHESGSEISSE